MNLPAFCIRRPAFTIVISLVMMIIGMIGFINLPVRWIPNVNMPQINIITTFPGANAYSVEHDITKVIEGALSGINGIESLTSSTRREESQITITLKLGSNMDAAIEEVRTAVERVRSDLPKESKNPTVVKADPGTQAILYISFYDKNRNARELSDYIDQYIVPSFETIDGVANVSMFGKRVSAMQIKLDPNKMAGANVTVDEITQLLQAQNASIPSGQIRGLDRFYSVITDTSLKSAEQFNDLIIRNDQNHIVRLKDIGEAKLDVEDSDTIFRINGKSAIALGIVPQSMANPLDVERHVQKTFQDVKRSLPVGMEANIVFNKADYIRSSIHSVYESFIEAVVFVWLVIFVFLGNFRATLIPIITIPVCLISTFALLYFFGFSINTITLMAFVLAIGLVVDDAIVMLENISRHIEEGMPAFAAALKGSREITFPIIAMTLTLSAVYAPIAFTPGLLGILFREFTFTLAGAVLISGIIALTLSPMMCARILKQSIQPSRYQSWFFAKMNFLQMSYQEILIFILHKKSWVLGFLFLTAMLGAGIYYFLPSELAPAEDMSQIYVSLRAPHSASFKYTDSYASQLAPIYKNTPEIDSYLSMMFSPSQTFQILLLKPRSERTKTTAEIIAELTARTNILSGVQINYFSPAPPLLEFTGGDDGDSLGIVIMTTNDYRKLQESTQRMLDAIKQIPSFIHAENTLKWDSIQFQVNVDRDRAADLKVPITNITNTLSTLIAGRNVGKMNEANILVQMNEVALANPNIFQSLYVRNTDNKMLPLSSMLSVKEVTSPIVFHHSDRLRSDTIYLTLAPKVKISDAIKTLQKLAKEHLSDMKYTFNGEAKSFIESNGKILFTFLLALVFIYLVLVAQFESFIDPMIIMLTVPFAVVGAMLTLKIFGGSLNIYSNIGLITLVGLIAKHGILITEFANKLRLTGLSIEEAVIEAAKLRLRPILMTTAAMVLGALPLALAFGPGSESRQQIGLVITGGLLFGTFFSLIVVPVVYTYLAPLRKGNLTEENGLLQQQ